MTEMTEQNLEQTKLRTGQRQGLSEPFGAALLRIEIPMSHLRGLSGEVNPAQGSHDPQYANQ
jgi:hypothetical protein